jgi:hypothetical protein
MILLACQCAKALLAELANYVVEGTGCTLLLHIGVGAGEVQGNILLIIIVLKILRYSCWRS